MPHYLLGLCIFSNSIECIWKFINLEITMNIKLKNCFLKVDTNWYISKNFLCFNMKIILKCKSFYTSV